MTIRGEEPYFARVVPDDLPSGWDRIPLSAVCTFQNGESLPSGDRAGGDVPVYGSNGIVGWHDEANSTEPVIIIGRKGSAGAINYSECPVFVIDTAYYVDKNSTECEMKWLMYLLGSYQFNRQVEHSAVPGINRTFLGEHLVPYPTNETQNSISTFLDVFLADINDLIEKNNNLLQLLNEKRESVINRAVTRGVKKQKSLDSVVIPWLEEIPNHWSSTYLKYLVNPNRPITYGIVQAGPHVDDGVPYIRTSDMSGDQLPREGYKRTSREIHEQYSRSRVFPGDLVLAIRATVGKVLPVPEWLSEANLTQGTARISPGQNVNEDYLFYLLNSSLAQQHFDALSKGATFKEVTLNMVQNFPVPIPPLEEQQSIVDFIQTELAPISDLEESLERCNKLLEEKRQSLKTNAVTGQIDIGNDGLSEIEEGVSV